MPLKKAVVDWDSLGFDLLKTRSMYSANCRAGENWENGSLIPYGNIELSPAAVVLIMVREFLKEQKHFKLLMKG